MTVYAPTARQTRGQREGIRYRPMGSVIQNAGPRLITKSSVIGDTLYDLSVAHQTVIDNLFEAALKYKIIIIIIMKHNRGMTIFAV